MIAADAAVEASKSRTGAQLKLLVVSSFFDTHRGGIEIVAGRLAVEFASSGLDVTWAATNATDPPNSGYVQTIVLPACNVTERRLGFPYPIPGPRAFMRLAKAVCAADVVLLHDGIYATSVVALIAAKLARKPVVIVQHIGAVPYKSPLLRSLMSLGNTLIVRPSLVAADQVVFISGVARDFFGQVRFRRAPELIFNGVDTKVFAPVANEPTKATIRMRLGLPDGPLTLFVGRFVEKKGLHWLRGAALARPDIDWAFAGWGPLDPRTWDAPNVHVFSGLSGSALAELYQASDALVLPSVGEGFPLVVQEALACGLPVICGAETARADVAAAVRLRGVDLSGKPAEVVGRLVTALDTAFAEPRSNAVERAAFARERYSWEAGAARYVELLELVHPNATGWVDRAPTAFRSRR